MDIYSRVGSPDFLHLNNFLFASFKNWSEGIIYNTNDMCNTSYRKSNVEISKRTFSQISDNKL